MSKKLIISGLGGGLDIVNAYFFHCLANESNVSSILGSSRSLPLSFVSEIVEKIDSQSCIIDENAKFKTNEKQRYAESRISQLLNENVLYLTRAKEKSGKKDENEIDVKGLAKAMKNSIKKLKAKAILFVDGGGDSLVLQTGDTNDGSEVESPFEGGDAQVLAAIHQTETDVPIVLATVAVGLDIDPVSFHNNVEWLRDMGGYFGRVNLVSGETQSANCKQFDDGLATLETMLCGLKLDKAALIDAARQRHAQLAESLLVLDESQQRERNRFCSHTATVFYHAVQQHIGVQRTFVPWEPVASDGARGVLIDNDDLQWCYFFDARKVEELKIKLNSSK